MVVRSLSFAVSNHDMMTLYVLRCVSLNHSKCTSIALVILLLLIGNSIALQPFKKAVAQPTGLASTLDELLPRLPDIINSVTSLVSTIFNHNTTPPTLQPQNIEAQDIQKGHDLIKLGMYDQAKEHFDNVLKTDPTNVNALDGNRLVLSFLGNYNEAILYFNTALSEDTNNVIALDVKGWILFDQGIYDQARQYFEQELKNNPDDIVALDGEGEALGEQGYYVQALPYFNHVLAEDPNNITALNILGIAQLSLGNYVQALPYFNHVLAEDPNNITALNGLDILRNVHFHTRH
jgi:tetratricopeptide (TPR) repeat protein